MPSAEGRVDTDRAHRYLDQLREHLGHLQQGAVSGHHAGRQVGRAPDVVHVEGTGDRAVIVFDWGTCTLSASNDGLTIHAEAGDATALDRARALIGHRIETIGRRDDLRVSWQHGVPDGD